MKLLKSIFSIIVFALSSQFMEADVKLADIFSDSMVLQRNINLKIWGYADPEEELTLNFNGQNLETIANKQGNWEFILKPMSFGGPFVMTIEGKNKIVLKDILIGDVWVCSGQSNMAWSVNQSNNATTEIKNANYLNIRLFSVPRKISNVPITKMPNTSWEVCKPETIRDFSAVGYFFGRSIYLEQNIPIGLINSSWGNTCIETWTSKESITKLPKYESFGEKIDSFDIEKEIEMKKEKLRNMLGEFPENEMGIKNNWIQPETDRTNWLNMQLPCYWENAGYENLDGIVWFSFDLDLKIENITDNIELHLGKIYNSDITWVNGERVDEIDRNQNTERVYSIPQNILKSGKNNISVRVNNTGGMGGFGAKPQDFYIQVGKEKKSLNGQWKFKVDKVYNTFEVSKNELPSLVYNAMINPIIPYGIKGVIWYQGENNASRSKEYAITFPNLINNWREEWKQGDFPFLFVQLANFEVPNSIQRNISWAELRESQTKALSLVNTGMALTIDIGEADNIHPKNKQDVAKRVLLAAQKVAYNKNIVYSGPQYKSMKINGNKALIIFNHIGSGIEVKGNNKFINEFEIAGEDERFYTATAKVKGKKVIVWSDNVKNPVAVRFAWSNNPSQFNLYNKEGLPTIPFRTDDWKGLTDGKSFND